VKRSLNNGRKLLQYVQRFPGEYQSDARKMLADFAGADAETVVGKVEPKTFDEAKTNGQEAIQEMQSAQTIARALGPRVAAEKDPKAKAEAAKQLADSQKAAAENKDRALYYFDYALRLADEKSSIDDLNLIRYLLCYLKFTDGHYYESVVLGEFIARRYPASSGARPCAKIALAGYLKLYTENKTNDKDFESAKIVDVADYIVKTWPDQPEAEEALNTLIPFMIKERQLDRARDYLAKIPLDSKFRGAAELKMGQALWSNYLEGMREIREWETGEGNPPEAAEIAKHKKDLETLKTEARDTLANGVKRMQAGAEIGLVEASAVLSLAQIYVDTNEAAKAVALLEDPKIGTLTLVKRNDPAVERDPIPDETFKTALRAYISSLAAKGATPEQTTATIDKAKGIMAELKNRMGSTKEGQTKLVTIYVSLARDLQRQMDYAPPEAKSALGAGFKVFLDQVGSDASELNVLTWVAETYRGMGESFISDGKVSEEGRKYLEEASKIYGRILDLGKKDKNFLSETQELQIRLSLAKTLRSMGKFVEAMNAFEEMLKENSMMLPVQIEAAKTYQQMAALWKSDEKQLWKHYAFAIVGARPDQSKRGKNVIWGWGEIARMTANDKRFTDAFHEARYNLALCRYRMALGTKDAAKREKAMKQARSDIAITRGLFPDLGGDKWEKQYDKLFKDIQKQLGEKPVGLTALDTNKTASAP
jgi:tetratricopeptide (TPR) repeat protein